MNEILGYLIHFVLQAAAIFFFARFLLQACRVDFYNPISQGIVKITDPVLKPMRYVIPSYKNLDFAAFLMTWLAKSLLVYTTVLLKSLSATVLQLAIIGLRDTLLLSINFFYFTILIVILASFIAPGSGHPALLLLHQITEPLLAPFRRLIPSLGGFDLSPLVVFLLLGLSTIVVEQVFANLLG